MATIILALTIVAFLFSFCYSVWYGVQQHNKWVHVSDKLDETVKELLYWKRLFEEKDAENKALKKLAINNKTKRNKQ